jgi:hypothetical protein
MRASSGSRAGSLMLDLSRRFGGHGVTESMPRVDNWLVTFKTVLDALSARARAFRPLPRAASKRLP